MTDYAKKRDECQRRVGMHSRRANNFAALNVAAVTVTAVLAGLAAVTSAASVPTWVVTVSAGISAVLGVLTASYNMREKNVSHTELAADLKRLASRYEQLVGLRDAELHGEWLQNLEAIETYLDLKESDGKKPMVAEATWAAASRPARTGV